jgi:2'-5' RNA ligase
MEKFTQKWAIISLLDSVSENSEFYYTDFPLHITLAGVFKTNHDGAWLANGLAKLLSSQRKFGIEADEKTMLGPNQNIAVMKIKKTRELMGLHQKINNWLIDSGAIYNEPKYQGAGYLPHSTSQKSGRLVETEKRQISQSQLLIFFQMLTAINARYSRP